MTILQLVIHPDDRLRQQVEPITEFDEKLHTFLEDMHETRKASHGVGLAAPQVGVLTSVFVVGFEDRCFELINPKITHRSGSEEGPEGCLSIPDLMLWVDRATDITVSAQDRFGNDIELKESGFVARIIQHEMDHLEGVLIIDRSSKEYVME